MLRVLPYNYTLLEIEKNPGSASDLPETPSDPQGLDTDFPWSAVGGG